MSRPDASRSLLRNSAQPAGGAGRCPSKDPRAALAANRSASLQTLHHADRTRRPIGDSLAITKLTQLRTHLFGMSWRAARMVLQPSRPKGRFI